MYLLLDEFKVDASRCSHSAETVDTRLLPMLAEWLHIPVAAIAQEYRIVGKSIDARRGKPEIIYRVALEIAEPFAAQTVRYGATLAENEWNQLGLAPIPDFPENCTLRNPVVVGGGPAGLLAAWYLAQAGCAPLVLDRGFDVDTRVRDCEQFFATRELNEESNLLFGAGGAGTFSDGKLYTRVHDPHADWVLRVLLAAGAPADTAYLKRPHLGSDLLHGIVKNLRNLIEQAGGTFRFGAAVRDVIERNNRCVGVELASGERIEAPAVLMAYGLGGRDLSLRLASRIQWEMKGFQLGCRVEHLQSFVDARQYRQPKRSVCLGAAEYNLIAKSRSELPGSGVTTFCMCPGGEIVPTTAWRGHLSSNGMSLRARSGQYANAAVITTMPQTEFQSPAEAYNFLGALEAKSFAAGGSDYSFPAESLAGFLRGEALPITGGTSARLGARTAPMHEILPKVVVERFQAAFGHFEKLMPGFLKGNAVGVESCVSSPVRFTRNPETMESSLPGLYVAGEGAGYAGGIVSAAIDGLKAAEKMAQKK